MGRLPGGGDLGEEGGRVGAPQVRDSGGGGVVVFQAEEPAQAEVEGLEGACMFLLALNLQVSVRRSS